MLIKNIKLVCKQMSPVFNGMQLFTSTPINASSTKTTSIVGHVIYSTPWDESFLEEDKFGNFSVSGDLYSYFIAKSYRAPKIEKDAFLLHGLNMGMFIPSQFKVLWNKNIQSREKLMVTLVHELQHCLQHVDRRCDGASIQNIKEHLKEDIHNLKHYGYISSILKDSVFKEFFVDLGVTDEQLNIDENRLSVLAEQIYLGNVGELEARLASGDTNCIVSSEWVNVTYHSVVSTYYDMKASSSIKNKAFALLTKIFR